MNSDFKYWEDKADAFKEEGSLLPLWRFNFKKARYLSVTCIAWNPRHSDLFTVGYGSCNFLTMLNFKTFPKIFFNLFKR